MPQGIQPYPDGSLGRTLRCGPSLRRALATATRPTHHVFVVDGERKDAFWTRIGAAWQMPAVKGSA